MPANRKIINKWNNKGYGAEVREYLYPSGIKLVEAVKPGSLSFDIAIVIKAGTYYEGSLGVPDGTAHMLEHILFSHPNKVHKTKQQVKDYLLGSKDRPSIGSNASTSMTDMQFYGSAHHKGAERLVKSLIYKMDFPLENIGDLLEEEKRIVQAELAGLKKISKDEYIQSNRFLLKETYPEYHKRIIGTAKSIEAITANHLQHFYKKTFTAANTVVAVQSGTKITPAQHKLIKRLLDLFPNNQPARSETQRYEVTNGFALRHFPKPENQSVYLAFCNLVPRKREIDYTDSVLFFLAKGLLNKLIFDELRTKQQLIYSGNYINSVMTDHWLVRGFKLECRLSDLPNLLKESHKLIKNGLVDFLDSPAGKRWFVSRISDYIFPGNQNYSSGFATDIAEDILIGKDYKFNDNLSNRVARKTTITQLKDYIQEHVASADPKIWIVSPYPSKQVEEVVLASDWAKHA